MILLLNQFFTEESKVEIGKADAIRAGRLASVQLDAGIIVLQDPLHTTTIRKNQAAITVEDAYKECFDRYFERLFSYAFTIVKDNAEAKDIVQTAFVKLWEKRGEVNLPAAAKSYLYTSVYHLALNTIRNKKSRESHHQKMIGKDYEEDRVGVEIKETRERIAGAINELPPRCREVFNKSRMEGKKYAEIANELDISVKTVEVQMGKALKMLRERLADLLLFCVCWLLF